MSYDRDIIFILNEAGPKGLSVKKIARHVYNHNNGFFNVVSFEDVYRYVSSYLIRTSKCLILLLRRQMSVECIASIILLKCLFNCNLNFVMTKKKKSLKINMKTCLCHYFKTL